MTDLLEGWGSIIELPPPLRRQTGFQNYWQATDLLGRYLFGSGNFFRIGLYLSEHVGEEKSLFQIATAVRERYMYRGRGASTQPSSVYGPLDRLRRLGMIDDEFPSRMSRTHVVHILPHDLWQVFTLASAALGTQPETVRNSED